jgi:hypothetical protein
LIAIADQTNGIMVTDAMRIGEDGMSIRGEDGGRSEMQERKKKKKRKIKKSEAPLKPQPLLYLLKINLSYLLLDYD